MTHPESEFHKKAFSPAFMVHLAQNPAGNRSIERLVDTPEPEPELKPESISEPTVSAQRTVSGEDFIAKVQSRQLKRTEPIVEQQPPLQIVPEDTPASISRKAIRGFAKAVPTDELRDRVAQRIDPEGQLKVIVLHAMAEIRENIRDPHGRDPYDIVSSLSFDPGVNAEDIRFLHQYVALAQDKLSTPPKHKQHTQVKDTQPEARAAGSSKNAIESRVEVKGYLSGGAKAILNDINDAINRGMTSIHGDPFRTHVARAVHDSGFITPSEARVLLGALDDYEKSRSQ
jgi:hypothetical protein